MAELAAALRLRLPAWEELDGEDILYSGREMLYQGALRTIETKMCVSEA
jgi:hypothetical protein